MTLTCTYTPDTGFTLGDRSINWGMSREEVRGILQAEFEESNTTTDMSFLYGGSHVNDIEQRQDIYQDYGEGENNFVLGYDEQDSLTDLEIHYGADIQVKGKKINFDLSFEEAVGDLKTVSSDFEEMAEGEYLFRDLKISVMDEEMMGGEGNKLGYFYCSNDISHFEGDAEEEDFE